MPSPKLNPKLIPIKKLVIDIRKGAILRTYYIKPETLMQIVERLRSEPLKQHVVKVPMQDKIDLVRQTDNINVFRNDFQDTQTFNAISDRYANKDLIEEENPSENIINTSTLGLINYITTLDKGYIRNLSRELRNATKDYQGVSENIKFTRVKTASGGEIKQNQTQETQEVQSVEQDINLSELGIDTNIDNQEFKGKSKRKVKDKPASKIYMAIPQYKLIKVKNPKKVGDKLSKVLNYLHPQKDKMLDIYKKLLGSDLKDKNYITHNVMLSVDIYDKTRDISIPLIQSITSDAIMTAKRGGEEFNYIDYANIIQLLSVLYILDKQSFQDLSSAYIENEVIYFQELEWIINSFKSKDEFINSAVKSAISYINNSNEDKADDHIGLYVFLLIGDREMINSFFSELSVNNEITRQFLDFIGVYSGNILANAKDLSLYFRLFDSLFSVDKAMGVFWSYYNSPNNLPLDFFMYIHKANYLRKKLFGKKSLYICYDTIHKLHGHRVSPSFIAKINPVMGNIMKGFENEVVNGIKETKYKPEQIYIPIVKKSNINKGSVFNRLMPIMLGYINKPEDEFEDYIKIKKDLYEIITEKNGKVLVILR